MNYRHIPVRGLYELRRAVDDLKGHLGDVNCPVTVLQGDKDPVVMPESAERIIAALGSENKKLHWIAARRHGILREDIGASLYRPGTTPDLDAIDAAILTMARGRRRPRAGA